MNNWRVNHSPTGTYGTDCLTRAVIAQMGLGAKEASDAVYPFAMADSDGYKWTRHNVLIIPWSLVRIQPGPPPLAQ